MRAFTFRRLITRVDLPHAIMSRRAAVLRVRLDTVPFDHQDHPARILYAGKKLNAVGTRVVGIKQDLAEYFYVLVAPRRIYRLNGNLVNHGRAR
jgi:hypothetical protein